MSTASRLAKITLVGATLWAAPGYAQTELDDYDSGIVLLLTGGQDTVPEQTQLFSSVGNNAPVDVCRRLTLSHSGVTTSEPTSFIEVDGGTTRLDLNAPTGTNVGAYLVDMFYGQCTSDIDAFSSLGLSVPTSISVDYDNVPPTDKPAFFVYVLTNDGSSNTTHTLQLVPPGSGSRLSGTLTFNGASFSPPLPTSGSTVVYVHLRVTGSEPSSGEEFEWANFQLN